MKKGNIVKMSQAFKDSLLGKCYYNDEGFLIHTARDPLYEDLCHNCSSEHLHEFGHCLGIIESINGPDIDVRWQPSNLRYGYISTDLEIINEPIKNTWFIYILKCKDKTLYTGITNNLVKRIKQHNDGKGARYTKGRKPVQLIRFHTRKTKSEALKLEYQIKQLPKDKKLIFGKVIPISLK